jgi:hypothetical protein
MGWGRGSWTYKGGGVYFHPLGTFSEPLTMRVMIGKQEKNYSNLNIFCMRSLSRCLQQDLLCEG